MLATFTILTTIFLILFFLSLTKEWEVLAVASGFILVVGGLICWLVLGFTHDVKVSGKIIPKNNYEILIGEDKIIITNLYTKLTQTMDDARSYNIITKDKDKYYIEYTYYNMYNGIIKTEIEIKDLRFIVKN